MKTIAKNRKGYIEELFSKAENCVAHSLESNFHAEPVSAEWIKRELFRFSFAKLRQLEGNKFRVGVHGNLWYNFTA